LGLFFQRVGVFYLILLINKTQRNQFLRKYTLNCKKNNEITKKNKNKLKINIIYNHLNIKTLICKKQANKQQGNLVFNFF